MAARLAHLQGAGEGSAAAIALNNDLVEQDVRDAVALFRLGMPLQRRPRPPAGHAGTDPYILEESS